MTSASDITEQLGQAASDLKEGARKLGSTAIEANRDQIIEPAREAAVQAGHYAQETCADASEMARAQIDRAISWTRANPFAAVGIAFAAGVLFAKSTLSSDCKF